MSDKPKYKVGYWVRHMEGQKLLISRIEYVMGNSKFHPYTMSYITTNGIVQEEEILEARK